MPRHPVASPRVTTSSAALIAVVVAAAGCREREGQREGRPVASPPPVPAAVAAPVPAPTVAGPLTWYHDVYPAALARAKAAGLPLFVDLWASWCHTCISMQETVLRDPAMAPFADRFVWLALDTENGINAPTLERLPPDAWPTFYVVSSADETVQARHVGAASLAQLREMMTAGEAGHLEAMASGGALAKDAPLEQVRVGDRAAAAGDHAGAAKAYGKALSLAPADWSRAPDVLVRQTGALSRANDLEGCAELGEQHAARTRPGLTASVADFASIVSGCAEVLPAEEAAALRRTLVREVERAVDAPDAALSADDRGDALAILRELATHLGQPEQARAYAIRQRQVLDAAAAAATSPWMASTYNMQRADVYSYLGDGEKMVPVLEKSMADLPTAVDPAYRLASLLFVLERWDEGVAAAEKALALATGPRRAQVLDLLARLHHGKGDHAQERTMRELALAHLVALPAGQRRPATEAAARTAISEYEMHHVPAGAPAPAPISGAKKP